MGAAGSIMLADGEDVRVSPSSAFPPLTKASSKIKEVGSLKSKFPSISQPVQIGESQMKDQPVQTFKISIPHNMSRIHDLKTSKNYSLRVSPESLDIIDEGRDTLSIERIISDWIKCWLLRADICATILCPNDCLQ